MATITLYANKINNMPSLIKDVKSSVKDLNSELTSFKKKCSNINKSVCNLDDVICSISTSTQTQEQKVNSLENLSKNIEQFASDVEKIDSNVADMINKNKDDFYNEYSYLKPECEKNGWEKFCDGVKSVGEWCKEHWKTILKVVVVVVLVVVSVVLLCTGVGGILAGAAWGCILGAVIGGVSGGVTSAINGTSIFDGIVNGAFTGAIGGAIGGGLTSGLTSFIGPASTLLGSIAQNTAIGALSGGISNSSVTTISLLLEHGTLSNYGSEILASGFSGALVGGVIGGGSEVLKNISVFKSLSKQAQNADVSTNANETIFYSGKNNLGVSNGKLAQKFALQNGKKTIEMTPGGKLFDKMNLFNNYKNARVTNNQAAKIWGILSDNYSKQATGNVFEFVEGALPTRAYMRIELPNINVGIASGRITNVFSNLLKAGEVL